ncbi:Uncharacterised protein [Mycobacteroides abscessus subsp. abscessus]|nr:Uncharacterised protein [Mycobacteroides abscessus subsp. abscessus]
MTFAFASMRVFSPCTRRTSTAVATTRAITAARTRATTRVAPVSHTSSPRIKPLTIAIGFPGAVWSVPRWMPAHTLPPTTATRPAMRTAGNSPSEADGSFTALVLISLPLRCTADPRVRFLPNAHPLAPQLFPLSSQ